MSIMKFFNFLTLLTGLVSARFVNDIGSLNFSLLATQLSPGASIILPDDPLFDLAQQRWQAYARPTYSVVVQVATEQDVKTTVLFANKYSVPFLAVTGAHGFLTTLGRMQGGIAISLTNWKTINISQDGSYADLQPGLTNGELIRYLWPRGKVTVTGNCLCTGITGIMLGGGHGYLQGLYGLLADQILEAHVVLANGELVVASPTSNPDLFWGLRGAGHNLGIVTKIKYKLHDAAPRWTITSLILTHDKLEDLFEVANAQLLYENHPAQLSIVYQFIRLPPVDPDNASIMVLFIYGGPSAEVDQYMAPYISLGVANSTSLADAPYPDIFRGRGDESNPAACAKGWYRGLGGSYLKRFNPQALRQVHTIFTNVTSTYPDIQNRSLYILESYGHQGVAAVPHESTAVPYRQYPILAAPVWGYNDISYHDDLTAASEEIRRIVTQGDGATKLRSYVNYAIGNEEVEENYGHETWRLKKLRKLKMKYDPKGRFDFYAPIDGRHGWR